MGSLRTPVGPLPSSIYWRRRAVVLLLIALVVLLVFWALRSGGGDDEPAGHDDGAGGPAESITPGPTPSESLIDERPGGRDDSPSGDETGEDGGEDGTGDDGSGGDGGDADGGAAEGSDGSEGDGTGDDGNGSGSGSGAGLPECTAGALEISLRSDANAYAPGEEPEIRLTVANTGPDCRVDFGHEALTITVANTADEQVWSSADCPTGLGSDPVAVPADGSANHTFTWDRQHSTADCDGTGPDAAADSYLAEAALADYPVVQTTFRFEED
ncbi:hypothetical protein [Streptomyces johnsoniae]|uniref:DUF4232 domain-containing protein n=1 Tax=Streptomyces johnsoniae TaxID=3075532 RepID=A0ABU2SD62_9ACTN|nr:hypothetical protein [Streptomyces sp. DSM 41886]MDT0446918.1 hypothetical protein [Streptomyces sp. DSM 41886]